MFTLLLFMCGGSSGVDVGDIRVRERDDGKVFVSQHREMVSSTVTFQQYSGKKEPLNVSPS